MVGQKHRARRTRYAAVCCTQAPSPLRIDVRQNRIGQSLIHAWTLHQTDEWQEHQAINAAFLPGCGP